ncbi:MAG: hypothetical protein AB1427_16575 [Thermodesulfobacteriota bacterium]
MKKMIVLIAAALAFSVVADYLGIMHVSVQKEKPKVLQVRDEYVFKTTKNMDPSPF